MKFLALFAAGALAAGPLAARQVDQIAANVQTIADNTQALSQGVSAFDGSPDSVISLQQAASTLIDSINSATSALPTEQLSPVDATDLVPPFTALRDQVGESIDGVIAQEQAFVDASVAGIVYDQLTQIRAASQALSDGILALVPEALQEIAQGLSDPILADLDRGVQAFEQYAEQTGGPSDSGAPETSSSEPTATESSAAPTGTTTSVGTTSAPAEPTETSSLPPYDDNAAVPTAAAAYGAMGLAALAAIAAF